jgi:hypothetical protein
LRSQRAQRALGDRPCAFGQIQRLGSWVNPIESGIFHSDTMSRTLEGQEKSTAGAKPQARVFGSALCLQAK